MANIINGDNGAVSGSAGLKSSADSTGVLALQTNGTTAVSISTGQVVTLTNALAVTSGGTGVTTSTGSGAVVLGTSPTLTTPTINSAQIATVTGTAPLYIARAWVNFNGTGTVAIRASGNVTSITDNGVGDYTVNFTTAMPDTNYSFFGSSGQTAAASIPAMLGINRDNLVYSTTAIRLYNLTGVGGLPDSAYLNVCIFR